MPNKNIDYLISVLLFIVNFSIIQNASALSLMEAYEAALANDSVYRSAVHENEAGQQNRIIGRANLLPIVTGSYAYNRVNSDISASGNGVTNEITRNYNSENAIIQLRQPIFNMESWARYHQGNFQSNLSDKQLKAQRQELIKRFFGLYAQANYAEDVLALSLVQRDAFKNQTEANRLMSAKGEGTKTAFIESQAKLSLAEAQVIEAQDGLAEARNSLQTMLGVEFSSLDRLTDSFKAKALEETNYETLKKIALDNNPEIAAKREAVEIAYQEIKLNSSGHLPKLDAVASISRSKSDSPATFNQDIDNKSIGLQLNVPIYSGGSVSALTSQAEANYKKAQDNLETKSNEVLLDLLKQFNKLQSGILRIDALRQSVESSELLVIATKKSLIGGVRTNIDVLDARKQLFEAKRDYSLARYNYLVALVNLKKATGMLNEADLIEIGTQLSSSERQAMFKDEDTIN